jgi:hypothetical protein
MIPTTAFFYANFPATTSSTTIVRRTNMYRWVVYWVSPTHEGMIVSDESFPYEVSARQNIEARLLQTPPNIRLPKGAWIVEVQIDVRL